MNNTIQITQGTLHLPDLPSTLELSMRIMLAAALGALMGLEREINDHPSGLRTHIAVAIGAATFGIVSAYAFTEFIALRADNNYQVDVTRVASQVVVGVGFLGGGAIIKQGNSVRGLTSAAGLWVSSAVGLAVGLGMYTESIVATVTLVLALALLKKPSRWLRHRVARLKETIVISIPLDSDPSRVIAAVSELEETIIKAIVVNRREADDVLEIEIEIQVRGGERLMQSSMAAIERLPEVLSVELG